MKIAVETTVDIDPERWAAEYGVGADEVRSDVQKHYEQILWQLAETFNRTGAHQL